MLPTIETNALDRLAERAREWRVSVDETSETETSVIAFGRRATLPVVLKIIKRPGDEWRCGEILDAFAGRGVVRVYGYVPGAILLERLIPGHRLSELPLHERDDEATEILAEVIRRMSPSRSVSCPSVQDWAAGFDRYVTTGDNQIPRDLIAEGRRVYAALCASQTRPRLLHGDLQHYNVLFDAQRGWLAIDPKGVVGEIEYEVGAALRNPVERPELFAKPVIVQTRLATFASRLRLDGTRALAWSFAQAVLSAIWDVEDGFTVDCNHPSIRLTDAVRQLLPNVGSG